MTKKNIGGSARRIEISIHDLSLRIEESEQRGFENGMDAARRLLRDEILKELEDEIEAFDPHCDLCIARRDLKSVGQDLAAARSTIEQLRSRARGWIVREGKYPYRET